MITERSATYTRPLQEALAGKLIDARQYIEPRFNAAKEWTINTLHAIGLTTQAWIKAVNSNPFIVELKEAAKDTLNNSDVQDFLAEKAGQVASRNTEVVNAALTVSSTMDELKPHLKNPVVKSLTDQMKKKPEGKRLYKKVNRIVQVANIFSESMRIQRLKTEIA